VDPEDRPDAGDVAAEEAAPVVADGAVAEEDAEDDVEEFEVTAGWIPATFGRCGEVMGGGSGCG
jgi:hypothetical protein